jgi:hypothetical protein
MKDQDRLRAHARKVPAGLAIVNSPVQIPDLPGSAVRFIAILVLGQTEVAHGRKRKKLRGTVQRVIKPNSPNQPEKAQIDIQAADELYRKLH